MGAFMGKHISKTLTDKQAIEILERYLCNEIGSEQAQALLNIKRRRFFILLKNYRENPKEFSLVSKRSKPPRQLPKRTEQKIEQELKKENRLIEDKNNPIRRYNYSYVKTRLEEDHGIEVSLSTIIRRAKKRDSIKKNHPVKTMIGKS
jgi:hypothetical protein